MIIYSVHFTKKGKSSFYASLPVYTTIDNREVFVCDRYEAPTIAQICRQAYANALVKHMLHSLSKGMDMREVIGCADGNG